MTITDPSHHSDAQLLATFLGGRTPDETSVALMQRFGGLRCLFHAGKVELLRSTHVGQITARRILAFPELARRYYADSLTIGHTIKSPQDTAEFLSSQLCHLPHEVFCCLFLDNRHRIIRFEPLFRGTIDGTSVYPREVVKEALAVNAAAVILSHNHPSGVAEPSQADERITQRLKSALELVDIRLLDHLIVGDGETVSLASRGLI